MENLFNEAETRYNLIDPLLVKAGWDLADRRSVGFEIPVDGYDAAPVRCLPELISPYRINSFCTKNLLEYGDLYETPFTNFGLNGVEKLFSEDEVEEILELTKRLIAYSIYFIMHYTKFVIKNYKGIKELTIDLDKEPKSKVLTLVGLNESGKTSILEAINLFQGDIPMSENHKLILKHQKLNFNDKISIKAFLRLSSDDEKLIKEFSKTLDFSSLEDLKEIAIEKGKNFINSVFSNEDSTTFWTISIKGFKKGQRSKRAYSGNKSEEWNKIVEYIQDNLLPPIIYYPNFLFDFPSRIYLEVYPNESEEQETYREVIGDILDSIGGRLNTKDHILDRMKGSSEDAKEALESTISKMSSIVSETVFHAWQTLFQSGGKEIILKPGIEQGTPIKYFLEIRLKEGSNHFQIAERSLGFKWFFTFLLFTEFRKCVQLIRVKSYSY